MSIGGPTNVADVLLPSAARTATTATEALDNPDASGVLLILDATVIAAAESITPQLQTFDEASQAWVTITSAFTAVSTVTTNVLVIYPSALTNVVATVGQAKNMVLPRVWRVNCVHSSTGSHTYSLSAQTIA
jgi:hypothetical protein